MANEDAPLAGPDARAIAASLSDLASVLRGLGLACLAQRADELASRLCAGRVHLAVLGQFKRGKSTLLNALLGEAVLPSSVVPLTAVPTFLKPAPSRRIEVAFADDRSPEIIDAADAAELRSCLDQFVTEERNPRNALNVERVTVYHPAPVLASGAVLIDTPGIGSTFRHNTEATLNFLPQCDAALFVVSADPPITEAEAAFLGQVMERVPRIFFVLNKVDYLDERERDEAVAFLRGALERELGTAPEIIALSARRGLTARESGDARGWEASGCGELERALERFVAEELDTVLRVAVRDKARRLCEEAASHVALKRSLALMPLEELRARSVLFRSAVEEAVRQREIAHDLIAGDKKRLLARLEAEAAATRAQAVDALSRAVDGRPASETLEEVLDREVPAFFERALGSLAALMEDLVANSLAEHEARADDLVARVRGAAADAFGVELAAPRASEVFEMRREPYWIQHPWQVALHVPPASPAERVLPAAWADRKRRARERTAIERVVTGNVENLRWAVLQNVNDAFLVFDARLDRMLAEVVESIEHALAEAESSAALARDTAEAASSSLDRFERELAVIAETLSAS
ncbi:MAG: dynamin family protein [Coriobacteriia bacterium]|nr:dynamin family protein [Coriobacteriia bacterium]